MIKIERASELDIDTIVQFQLNMAKETENLVLDKNLLEKGVNSVFDNENFGSYYIAKSNNEIVASLLTTFEWSDWRNGTILWIQSVYVTKEFREKGIYREMYAYLENLVENNDNLVGIRLYVDRTNIPAQKVYESLGMNGEHYKCYEWIPE